VDVKEYLVIYVNAVDENLIAEAESRAISKINPSTYNGRPIYSKFNITIVIPL
jgi:hypothetical protein